MCRDHWNRYSTSRQYQDHQREGQSIWVAGDTFRNIVIMSVVITSSNSYVEIHTNRFDSIWLSEDSYSRQLYYAALTNDDLLLNVSCGSRLLFFVNYSQWSSSSSFTISIVISEDIIVRPCLVIRNLNVETNSGISRLDLILSNLSALQKNVLKTLWDLFNLLMITSYNRFPNLLVSIVWLKKKVSTKQSIQNSVSRGLTLFFPFWFFSTFSLFTIIDRIRIDDMIYNQICKNKIFMIIERINHHYKYFVAKSEVEDVIITELEIPTKTTWKSKDFFIYGLKRCIREAIHDVRFDTRCATSVS